MPKIKTHKASAKRFKKRGNNKLKRRSAYATHLLGQKTTKRKRDMRRNEPVSAADQTRVKRALALK